MQRLIGGAFLGKLWVIVPRWVVEIAVALLCVALSGLARLVLDLFAPGALAFGIVYPVVLLAALTAGWRAGVLTLLIAGLSAWYFVLPPHFSFALPDHTTAVTVATFFVTGAVEVILASFAMHELQARLAEQAFLRREIDHRVRNNFQMVIGLLQMQAAQAPDGALRAGLKDAANRIAGFARAHRRLYDEDDSDVLTVNLCSYLKELCEDLSDAVSFGGAVGLECDLADHALARDRAVAVGAIVNELVTNAFKHAFAPGEPGKVRVTLDRSGAGVALTISDDGRGLPGDYQSRQGIGHRLVTGLVKQAEGTLQVNSGRGGASFTLTLNA